MAIDGYIPRVRLTLEGGFQPTAVLEGSEATILVEVLDQSGQAADDGDISAVSWCLYIPSTGAYVNSRSAVRANNTITQSGAISNDETVTINGLAYTFKDTPAAIRHVQVGADDDETMDNLAATINLLDPLVTASYATPVLTIRARTPGVNGNSISLAKSATNLTIGGGGTALENGDDGVNAAGDATQRIPLLAADNIIVGAAAEGESELHVFRVVVKMTSGINDLDASALDTVIQELRFYVKNALTPAAP